MTVKGMSLFGEISLFSVQRCKVTVTFAPRRGTLRLSASRTNNKHHRPEVALNKSNKHEPGSVDCL